LISSKSFVYQQMHFISVLENIKIYIKTAPTSARTRLVIYCQNIKTFYKDGSNTFVIYRV